MAKKTVLLVIDPQVDFTSPTGALYVKGGEKDMERLAKMITRCKGDIDDTLVTLDSHRTLHVAHSIMWVDKDGNHPAPFTLIERGDVEGNNPRWKSFNPGYQQRLVEYVQKLDQNGRYKLNIWPVHCRIGSNGYCVAQPVFEALCAWEEQFAAVNYVTKGSNMFTEHYSCVAADVYDPEDPKTGLNTDLLKVLQDPDVAQIGISGEASSHCVKFSIEDIANNFGEENIKKFVFLEDTCSPVTGFEQQAVDFVNSMTKRGMKVTTSDKFLK